MIPRTRTLPLILLIPLVTAATLAQGVDDPATDASSGPVEAGAPEVAPAADSYEVRERFVETLSRHPWQLGTVLVLDPDLLSNHEFLAGYPELERFVSANPEVGRSPRFFLEPLHHRIEAGVLDEALEGLAIFAIFLLTALALAWLLRTLIEQKRWSRLARTQTEVHTKILDRFGSSQELLEYMRTPAGARFLESAPIPLYADRATPSSPVVRVLWSVQIGIVVAAAAAGVLLVSQRLEGEMAQGLFAMGAIGLSVGLGFLASAAVSMRISRRLGLWDSPDRSGTDAPRRLDDTMPVR